MIKVDSYSQSDRVVIAFEPPVGYYYFVCFYGTDESNNKYTASVFNEINYMIIISLPPGNEITYYLETQKNDLTAQSDTFKVNTSKTGSKKKNF